MAGGLVPTNIMDVADYVQKKAAEGTQIGRQNKFNQLAGQAYTAPAGEQRTALLGQAVGVDPSAGVALGNQLASSDASAATAQDNQLKKIGGAARYMLQAIKTNNPAAVEGAYQAVRPYLSQFAQAQGKPVPDHYDPQMEASIQQIVAQTGGMPEEKGIVLSAGGQLRNPMTGDLMANNPQALQYHNVPMGSGQAAGAFDPATGQVRPAVGGMSGGQPSAPPAGDAMTPFIAQANAAIQMGADEGKVRAWLMQKAQQSGLQPQGGSMGAPAPQAGDGMGAVQGQPQAAPQEAQGQFGVGTAKSADNAPSGYAWNSDHSRQVAVPGGPADKTNASSEALGDSTKTGNAYLSSIDDPSMQAQIQAIAEGRMPLPKVSRPGKHGEISPQTLQQAVAQYDPTYDQADPTSRIKARNDFTSGKSAVQLRQLNTLLGHIGGLADAADKLDNTGNTLINAGENAIGSTYNTKVSNFDAAARPAAEEFAALLKGGVPSVEEIKAAHDMLSPNKTPDQLHGVIGTMAAQIQSRIAALNSQAKNSLGPFASKVTIITPEGQTALDNLRNRGMIGKFDLGEEAPQQASAQQPAQTQQPRAVDPSTGHAIVWNGSEWVPE